jgi:hypothetical protein
MSILEGEIKEDSFVGDFTPESEKEAKEEKSVTYEQIEVNSFSQAVEEILSESDKKQSFCFVDFDQTLTGADLRNVRDPQISSEVKDSFNKLLGKFSPGRLCLTTNRGYGSSVLGNLVFRTDKALDKMTELLEESSYPGTVPIFLGLKKQIPNLRINGRTELVNHLVDFIVNNNFQGHIDISMIEDYSLLAIDRSVFPKEIAKEVHKKLREEHQKEVTIGIKDYVLKHK